jgi:DNA polymerase I-like protein with 3'-5' exonuclease and polymerase domains
MMRDMFKEINSEWVAPTTFPDLSTHNKVSIDLETCDPELIKEGPGWPTERGQVIGIAVSSNGFTGYYPIAHEGGGNMDKKKVLEYVKSICIDGSIDKVFHNAQYDIGWLSTLGIEVKGRIHDTMVAMALIDENRFSYTLNSVSGEYLGERKNETKLREAADAFGVDPKNEMYRLPAQFVGEYAEKDARLTLKLHEKLSWEITKDNLQTVYDMECRLINVIFQMTKKGVRIDTHSAEKLIERFKNKEKKLLKRIRDLTNLNVEIWAAASIAKAFDALNLPYERTKKTDSPSFTKMFLTDHPHELPRLIMQARELNKLRGTFLHGLIKHNKEGRIHAHINQIRSDSGGTVTGRFSYNHPNLQQIPSRGQFAKDIRKIFIPEAGEYWLKADYSQQEPRLLTHFARLVKQPGSREVQEAYLEKDLDFHQQTADMAGVQRSLAKTIGLGVMYGMGYHKLARELDMEPQEAKTMLQDFHAKVPFMKGMLEAVMNRANSKGVIRTLLGRKCRFDLWEPTQWGVHKALPLNQAQTEHGFAIKRAYTYKALNRLIQGSAADQTKKAMVDVYEELGIIPLIQVHDELDCSVKDEKQGKQIKEIMENCVELEVPSKVDTEMNESWGG